MLPVMCKDTPEIIGRVSFILTQVMSSSDKLDIALVNNCLMELRDMNYKGSIYCKIQLLTS